METAKILAFALATWGIAFVAEAHQLTPREQLGKNPSSIPIFRLHRARPAPSVTGHV